MKHGRLSLLTAALFLAVPAPAHAGPPTVRVGLNVGGIAVLANQRLAIAPHVAVDWLVLDGVTLGLREEVSVLPPALGGLDTSPSVLARTTGLIGLSWSRASVSVGPTFTIYSMSACTSAHCAWTSGVAPGVDLQVSVYTTEWLGGVVGVQASGNVGYYDGQSSVLRDAWVGMATIGPVFRFGGH